MEWAQIVPAGGIVTLLALIIGYLLSANWKDRNQQQSVLTDLRNRLDNQSKEYEERLKIQSTHYDSRLTEIEARYTAKIESLQERIGSMEKEMEVERKLRIDAEIKAARLEYELGLPRRQRGTGVQ